MEAHRSKLLTPTLYLALGIALRSGGDSEEAHKVLATAARYAQTRDRAKKELRLLGPED
jgi:hypothetical protein